MARKYKKRKRGYRRFFCSPRKGCRPYKGKQACSSVPADDSCADSALPDSENLCAEDSEIGFLGFDELPLSSEPSFKGIRVLSLFDGIGTALHVLDSLGISVEAYFSSEVDEKAISLLKYNYHDRITHVGCVKLLSDTKLASFGNINLLLGGSPCSELTVLNPKRLGLDRSDSTGHLFYEYHRVLQYLSTAAQTNGHKFFWLFENTSALEVLTRDKMSRYLGCKPVVRCASAHSPMHRKRNWWGNVPGIYEPRGRSGADYYHLQDYLMPYRLAQVKAVPTLTTTTHSQLTGKRKIFPVKENGDDSYLFITEEESLFGLPAHYTDGPNLQLSARRKMLGKAWCVGEVMEILRPLVQEFIQHK